MAFKMNPSGIRKNPMQKLQGMGWLNSPIKQTQEEIDAIAKENAMNNGLQFNDETGVYFYKGEASADKPADSDTPKMEPEKWKQFLSDYEKKHGEPWKKPKSSISGNYYQEFKKPVKPDPKDYANPDISTLLNQAGIYNPREMKVDDERELSSGGTQRYRRMMNIDELESAYKGRDEYSNVFAKYRNAEQLNAQRHTDDLSKWKKQQAKYDQVVANYSGNIESKEDTDQPDTKIYGN